MPVDSSSSSSAPRTLYRLCAAGCGRKATVVSNARNYCATCYGLRRTRIAAKSGGSRL